MLPCRVFLFCSGMPWLHRQAQQHIQLAHEAFMVACIRRWSSPLHAQKSSVISLMTTRRHGSKDKSTWAYTFGWQIAVPCVRTL